MAQSASGAAEGNRYTRFFWGATGVVCVLLIWHLFTAVLGTISPQTLPSPGGVLRQAVRLTTTNYNGTLLHQNVWASLQVVLAGWVIGIVLGVPLGIAMGWNEKIRAYLNPIVEILRPIPPPAWIPFAVLWFGIDPSGRIFVIAMASVMPCIINSYGAVRGCDPILVDAARCLGADERTIITRVVVPTVAPDILAGVRIAIGNAWMTVVAAELVASSAGLGFILIQAQYAIQPDVVLTSMFLIGLIGVCLSMILGAVERWQGAWR